jgi:hypothetical protein
MLSHAAVLRSDGTVFAHLHPAGNFSMAAQSFFAAKLAREAAGRGGQVELPAAGGGHSAHHGHGSPAATPPDPHSAHAAHHPPGSPTATESVLYLPYEFPEDGDYRIWVQFKAAGRILTAAFDAQVQ